MKKILSILAINSILVSSVIFAGAGVACNNFNPPNPRPKPPKPKPSNPWTPLTPSTQIPKLVLNNLKFYNINVITNNATNGFVINGQNAYRNIEEEIIENYHLIFPKKTLTLDNFNSNSTSINDSKTWAIQILNVNNSKTIENALNQQLIFPDWNEYNVLKDNALKVIITTNDPNTKILNSKNTSKKQVQVNGYLNKFIYTNKNLNKGKYINDIPSKTAIKNNLTQNNVIDLSQGTYHIHFTTLNFNSTLANLRTQLFDLSKTQRTTISKAIVSNLNNQLKPETNKLNSLGFLKIASKNVNENNAIDINSNNTDIIAVYANDEINILNSSKEGNLGSGWKIFIKIKVANWNYLSNYLTTPLTSVFAYLGSVSVNVQKWNLNNFKIYNISNLSRNNSNGIWIDGHKTYMTIATTIAKEYNFRYNPGILLTSNDFAFDTTSLNNKSWAIQILNIDDSLTIHDSLHQNLNFSENYKNLKDNALNVTITTKNSNILNSTSTIKIYLNKFIYNNKNVNKGNNIDISEASSLTQENVIDLTFKSQIPNFTLRYRTTANQLKNQFLKLKKNFKQEISSRIVLNLNNQLTQETEFLNSEGKLLIANNSVPLDDSNHFNSNDLEIYSLFNNIVTMRSGDHKLGNIGSEIYARLNIFNWNYLSNYLGTNNSYVYFYLGIIFI